MLFGGNVPHTFRSCDETGRFKSVGDLELGENEVPRQKFRKEIIRTGKFVKDTGKSRQEFEITGKALDHWVATFGRMNQAGMRVNIPATHKDKGDPRDSMGYVTAMERDGDKLVMDCVIVGKDAIEAAHRSDVSIKSPAQMVGDDGTTYHRPIEHVAMVTNPVISGLGEFIPLAASRTKDEPNEDEQMKEILEGIIGSLSLATEVTDDEDSQKAAVAEITKAIKKLQDDSDKATKLGKDLALARQQIEKLSKDDDYTPDPMLVREVGKGRRRDLDLLVEASRISPDSRDRLVDLFIGEDNDALELSLKNGDDGRIFETLIEVLKHNKVVKQDETSGPQTMTLSRLEDSKDASVRAMAGAVEARREAAGVK